MKTGLEIFTHYFDLVLLVYTIAICSSYLILAVVSAQALIYYKKKNANTDYREILASPISPAISLIAPAYNESLTIVENVRSLLALQYPSLEIVVVNDGSKDNTLEKLIENFDLEAVPYAFDAPIHHQEIRSIYKSKQEIYGRLLVIDKKNGGKADALNAGLNVSRGKFAACIDVDCVLSQDALLKMIKPFLESKNRTIAVGGVIRIANSCVIEDGYLKAIHVPDSLIARFQVMEYTRAFLMGRMGWSKADGLLLISGAFGLFDREIAIGCGGYDHNTVGEDMELIVRMRRFMIEKGEQYEVNFIPDPLCWTEAPSTHKILSRQRNRWMRGTIETLLMHKKMFFNPKYGVLGMFSYPYWFFFEWMAPIIETFGIVYFMLLALLNLPNWPFFFALMGSVYAFAMMMSMAAILFDELSYHQYKRFKDILKLITAAMLEPFFHHPFVVWWAIQGNIDFIKGKKSWGEMTRTGFSAPKK
ncbi:MAG: glycosyltransferase [Sphingobacteriaceae bacterium]|nr:glycosyltransferase [Sphingobacteriaceae bacterium]